MKAVLAAVSLNGLFLYIKYCNALTMDFSTSHSIFEYILIIICLVNTLVAFVRFKKTVLFHHPIQPTYPNDQSWLIQSRNANLEEVNINTDMDSCVPNYELRWVLKLWNPGSDSLYLLAWFSPAQVAIFYVMDASNWSVLIPCALLVSIVV